MKTSCDITTTIFHGYSEIQVKYYNISTKFVLVCGLIVFSVKYHISENIIGIPTVIENNV